MEVCFALPNLMLNLDCPVCRIFSQTIPPGYFDSNVLLEEIVLTGNE